MNSPDLPKYKQRSQHDRHSAKNQSLCPPSIPLKRPTAYQLRSPTGSSRSDNRPHLPLFKQALSLIVKRSKVRKLRQVVPPRSCAHIMEMRAIADRPSPDWRLRYSLTSLYRDESCRGSAQRRPRCICSYVCSVLAATWLNIYYSRRRTRGCQHVQLLHAFA